MPQCHKRRQALEDSRRAMNPILRLSSGIGKCRELWRIHDKGLCNDKGGQQRRKLRFAELDHRFAHCENGSWRLPNSYRASRRISRLRSVAEAEARSADNARSEALSNNGPESVSKNSATARTPPIATASHGVVPSSRIAAPNKETRDDPATDDDCSVFDVMSCSPPLKSISLSHLAEGRSGLCRGRHDASRRTS